MPKVKPKVHTPSFQDRECRARMKKWNQNKRKWWAQGTPIYPVPEPCKLRSEE